MKLALGSSTILLVRRLRVFRVALLPALTIACASISSAQEPQNAGGSVLPAHSPRVLGEKRTVSGISNFGQVTPTLFRGAQPTRQGFEALAKMGVDIVVDARGDRTASEGEEVSRLGMKYVAIPWHCSFPQDDVFVRFLKLLKENPGKKIFVHCRLGDDRTGMMIASYRMAVEGWSADDAMLEMQHFGFTFAHHLICPRLAHYEQSFPSRLESNPAFVDVRSPQDLPSNVPK